MTCSSKGFENRYDTESIICHYLTPITKENIYQFNNRTTYGIWQTEPSKTLGSVKQMSKFFRSYWECESIDITVYNWWKFLFIPWSSIEYHHQNVFLQALSSMGHLPRPFLSFYLAQIHVEMKGPPNA